MNINSRLDTIIPHHIRAVTFFFLALILSANTCYATTIKYSLDNVIQDNGLQMTGNFHWTYAEGDFENGNGVFTDLYIPKSRATIDEFTITFDINKSIEFSLTANIHSRGVDITLFLLDPLSSPHGAALDLSRSKYEIAGGGRGSYKSGAILPSTAPISITMWLFISSLLGLFGYFNFNKHK